MDGETYFLVKQRRYSIKKGRSALEEMPTYTGLNLCADAEDTSRSSLTGLHYSLDKLVDSVVKQNIFINAPTRITTLPAPVISGIPSHIYLTSPVSQEELLEFMSMYIQRTEQIRGTG